MAVNQRPRTIDITDNPRNGGPYLVRHDRRLTPAPSDTKNKKHKKSGRHDAKRNKAKTKKTCVTKKENSTTAPHISPPARALIRWAFSKGLDN